MHECIYVRKRFGQQIRLSSLGFREFTTGCRSVITYGKDSAGKVTVSLAGAVTFFGFVFKACGGRDRAA